MGMQPDGQPALRAGAIGPGVRQYGAPDWQTLEQPDLVKESRVDDGSDSELLTGLVLVFEDISDVDRTEWR